LGLGTYYSAATGATIIIGRGAFAGLPYGWRHFRQSGTA
jgi:hypothetical protein